MTAEQNFQVLVAMVKTPPAPNSHHGDRLHLRFAVNQMRTVHPKKSLTKKKDPLHLETSEC